MDAGEVEASAPGRGRQTVSTKSRSSKEPPRNERSTEGATKPVRRRKGALRVRGSRPQVKNKSLTSDHKGWRETPPWKDAGSRKSAVLDWRPPVSPAFTMTLTS